MSDTPLAARFARLIKATGPISLSLWMAEANRAYYAARDPFGQAGDFITAPEISQMFGEMVGIWCADIWTRAGQPRLRYVELGPGRGTLARDALRVMARFGLVPDVHFVETSPTLIAAQHALVPGATWHDSLADVPDDAPMLVVANEFLDALPVRQLVRTPRGWRERMVGLDESEGLRFVPVAGQMPMDAAVPGAWAGAPAGSIVETSPAACAIVADIAARLARHGGAGLIIDYGHAQSQLGSSLQALRAHAHADPFAAPGEADLTWLIDFAATAEVAQSHGARVTGLAEQGAWLGAMGIAARAEALARASPERGADIAAAHHRLTHADQMGALFKVLALAGPDWPDGAGF